MKALVIALAVLAFQQQEPVDSLPDLSHPWTLPECIDWAMDHNLNVVRQAATLESQEIDLNTAQNSWLPGVSAQASQNFSFGRGIGGNNTYDYGNSQTTGFNIGANMNLFDGMETPNRIQLAKLNLEAATADLEKARDDIRVAVAQAYVQILYNYEILDVAREQIRIDSLQVERLEGLFATGRASAAEVSQQRASAAQSRVTLIQAENNLRSSILDLSQLLELPSWDGFSIVRPAQSVPDDLFIATPDEIYADAVSVRPSIQAEEIRLQGTESSIRIAQAQLYPTLSLSGGMGTNYYSNYGGQGFWDQLSNNFSQYVGLTLNIPIFSRFAVRNQVRQARLQQDIQQTALQQARQQLYKEIQQAWNAAVAARAKYDASQQAADAARSAFELVQAKYENGKATMTEFNESRNQLMKTLSDSVQATYEYLFQTRLLEFYRGGELNL